MITASVQAQGFTAEAETLPGGSLKLALRNNRGKVVAWATFTQEIPIARADDAEAWDRVAS